ATAPQKDTAGPVSPLAIAISRYPPQRPKDLSKAISAAVAAASRPVPEAQPEAEAPQEVRPEQVAAAEPAKRNFAKAIPGEDEEPDLPAAKMPGAGSNASVAQNATFRNAIDLGKTNLIGVYGTPTKRYALIRTGSGQYKKVRVGDRVDGGTIAAITDNELRYKKGSRIVALTMPKG
ncbi:MAG: hypothetical protein LBE86_06485, partial [Gemmobacter sp.]|nr:hypothetical protein [Gemmobacter sp.]